MDMPALKIAEVVIVVVALVAFYVWQMRSLKRDRAETARQMAQAQAEHEASLQTQIAQEASHPSQMTMPPQHAATPSSPAPSERERSA
jgi:hypothetical protein